MTTRLRALLRYLYVEGLVPEALTGAVPSVAHWRLASLPKALGPRQVARLLESCDRRSCAGRRDFAIITVLWRLGLRAGEVARLSLDDVDWAVLRDTQFDHGSGRANDDEMAILWSLGVPPAWLRCRVWPG